MNGWFLSHPATRGLDIDDPSLTTIRHRLLRKKRFLYKLYQDWYTLIKENLGYRNSTIIELGSGERFFGKNYSPSNKNRYILSSIYPFGNGWINAILRAE